MIQLQNKTISADSSKALAAYQLEIDRKATFVEQIQEAKRIWPSRKSNHPFIEIKATLTAMCSGARRCCYCEDSMADEIEHIQPKNFFPNLTFSWDNFLYACGPCNGPKGNKVAVFHPNSTNYSELQHPQNGYLPDQPVGNPLLINPRIEDPLEYLWLDISGTFSFVPIDDNFESLSSIRSRYTIKVLRLNIRDDLRDARRNAFGMYKARLSEYVTQKENGQSQAQLNRLIDGIVKEQHPTVWMEIKRQHRQFPALLELFQVAPEALNW